MAAPLRSIPSRRSFDQWWRWATKGLIAPGVRAELGRMAPAALTVIPPVLCAATGIGVTATFEGVLVALGTDVAGLGEDVVGFGSAADAVRS